MVSIWSKIINDDQNQIIKIRNKDLPRMKQPSTPAIDEQWAHAAYTPKSEAFLIRLRSLAPNQAIDAFISTSQHYKGDKVFE